MADQVVSKDNAEHYFWGEKYDGWHLVKSSELSVIQERVPARGAEVRHYHEQAQQFFFVLSGRARLEVEDRVLRLGSGQGFHVPAGLPHKLANEGTEDVEFLVISVPIAHGDRVLVDDEAPFYSDGHCD